MSKPLILELKEKVQIKELFSSTTGVDNCVLSESSENYDFLEIVFKSQESEKVERVYFPNGKKISIQSTYRLDNLLIDTFSKHSILGKNINAIFVECGYKVTNDTAVQVYFDSINYNKITKVYGGKILL